MASRRKIIGVRSDSHNGIIDRWVAFFSNCEQETYTGEIPPKAVSMFCRNAKYGFKLVDGDLMIDLWYRMPEIKEKMLEGGADHAD